MMDSLIIATFLIGYIFIALEGKIRINKAAIALLTGCLCWTIYILFTVNKELVIEQLADELGEISQILFFLMGAMTIVELIDSYQGFEVITKLITTTKKRVLLWIICFTTFLLSAALDNLATTIVMVTLLGKLIPDKQERMLFVGMIIISANAGGAWSPIGDVTTTLLWIGGQITSLNIITKLFLPSLVNMFIPLLIVSFKMKGTFQRKTIGNNSSITGFEKKTVFTLGIGALVFVPFFKTLTHLPPYVGILIGLSVLWIVTEMMHTNKKYKNSATVVHALQRIDTSSILFFLGILVAVGTLQSTGLLGVLAENLDNKLGNIKIIALALGALSSIVDNVPLVAAAMGMYDLQAYPVDHYFWEFIAYCAGTGGSILIIGSAAGVAAMGVEKIDFFWYLKKISLLALAGYLSGAFIYLLAL